MKDMRKEILEYVCEAFDAGDDGKSADVCETVASNIMELIRQSNQPLTKREQFAMAALQGLLSQAKHPDLAQYAECAVVAADALFAELDNTSKATS